MSEASALLRGNKIELSFPYSLDTIDLVRGISGRKWNAGLKVWEVPASAWHANEIINRLPGFYIDPSIKKLALGNKIPPKLRMPDGLYDFQKQGVEFIVRTAGRCIVADDMGLGKTIEALSYVRMFGGKVLIISPANVVFKWRDECKKWLPDRTVATVTNGGIALPQADVLIMSYSIMVMQYARLKDVPFDVGIWDEAHYLKNFKAQRTRVAASLIEMGLSKVLFLSGTPFMNHPSELFSLLHMLDPIGFNNYWAYAIRYCGAGKIDGVWVMPKGVVTNASELAKRLERYMIRRTKQEVALELPDLSRSYIPVQIPNMAAYKKAVKDVTKWLEEKGKTTRNKAHVLTRLGILRQIVGEGKVQAAVELAEDILETDRKVVLFAHHKDVVAGLYAKLMKYGARIIDGSTLPEDRNEFSNEFLIIDSPIRVMIMSVAGAEGINLYSAADIIFVEREWTPAKEEQAEARLHRIGQKNAVTAHYLVALDTYDEKINAIIEQKRRIIGEVISQDEIVSVVTEILK